MANSGFKNKDLIIPYMYIDNSTTSVSFGVDGDDSNKIKISTSAAIGADPTTSDQFTIDPSANGDITLKPNGTGAVNIDYATQHAISIYGVSGALAEIGPLTNGQLAIGSTGLAPVAGSLTSTGATITISAGAGTINLETASAGFTWSVETDAAVAGLVDSGFIANRAGLVTITLPTTAAIGSIMRVTGINTAVGWRIAQNAGETIYFGTSATTTGVGGYLESTEIRDSVEIVCVVADTDWNVLASLGNITVV